MENREIIKKLEKQRIELIRRSKPRINPVLILSILLILGLAIFLLSPLFTGFATIETNSYTNFSEGTFQNTTWNFSGNFLQLNFTDHAANATVVTNGTYLSKIFDGGSVIDWQNISWIEGLPYGEESPSNGLDESLNTIGGINMSGNVLLFHFNNDSAFTENSTFAFDFSGRNNNGTIHDGPFFNSSGRFKQALEFDGINDYVWVGNASTTKYNDTLAFNNSNSFSVFVWARPKPTTAGSGRMVSQQGTTGVFGYSIGVNLSNHPFFALSESQVASIVARSVRSTSGGDWHLIGFSYNGSVMETYVDGIYQGNGTWTRGNLPRSNRDLRIGSDLDQEGPGVRSFNGTIDEVMIFNRSLSQNEIINMYKRGILQLNVSVKSCNDSACSGEDFTQSITNTSATFDVSDNQYFQYKVDMSTENTTYYPELYNVTINNNASTPFPSSYNSSVNQTRISQGEYVFFNTTWVAGTNPLDSWIFSIDNGTGTFTNLSVQRFTSSSLGISNATVQIVAHPGYNVTWRFFANDSSGNINVTQLMNFTVSLIAAPSGTGCGYVNNDLIITQRIVTKGTCFIINNSNLMLNGAGYNVSSNQSGYGVNITRFQNITIKRLELNNFSIGLFANNTINLTLEQLNIEENLSAQGILITESTLINISNNNITTSTYNVPAIKLEIRVNNTLIENNNIITSGNLSPAIVLFSNVGISTSQNQVSYINITRNNITLHGSNAVNAINTSSSREGIGSIITFNRISQNAQNYISIELFNGSFSNISFNNISSYTSGAIQVRSSDNFNINNNNLITSSGNAISLAGTNRNATINSNIITTNSGVAIILVSANSTIFYNNISTYGNAMLLAGTSLKTTNVSYNNFTTYTGTGGAIAQLASDSNFNTFADNYFRALPLSVSTNGGVINLVNGASNNNFTNNIVNASIISYGVSLRSGGAVIENNYFYNTITTINIFSFNSSVRFDNLTLVNGTTEIFFANVTIYYNNIDTRNNITTFNNSVFLNASRITPFNTTANITFNGVSYNSLNDYAILRDNDPCPSTICTKLNFNPVRFQVTGFSTYNTTEEKYPEWYSPSVNKTSITQNDWINLGTYWTDTVGLDSYIFSIDNGTGTFENHSAVSFTGRTNSSNVTIQATYTGTVQWRFFANDSSNNINATDIQSFNVSATPSSSQPAPTPSQSGGSGEAPTPAPVTEIPTTETSAPTETEETAPTETVMPEAADVIDTINYGEEAQQAAENVESSVSSPSQNPSESAETDGEVVAFIKTKTGDFIIIKSGSNRSAGISIIKGNEKVNFKIKVDENQIGADKSKLKIPKIETGLIIQEISLKPIPDTNIIPIQLILIILVLVGTAIYYINQKIVIINRVLSRSLYVIVPLILILYFSFNINLTGYAINDIQHDTSLSYKIILSIILIAIASFLSTIILKKIPPKYPKLDKIHSVHKQFIERYK